MDILSNYCGYKNREVILVFDGYRVKGSRGERFQYHNLYVVYTRENETGDMYIESLVRGIGKHDRVWVATSDSLIQLSAFRTRRFAAIRPGAQGRGGLRLWGDDRSSASYGPGPNRGPAAGKTGANPGEALASFAGMMGFAW